MPRFELPFSLDFDPTGQYGVNVPVEGTLASRLRDMREEIETAERLIQTAEARGFRIVFDEEHHGSYRYTVAGSVDSVEPLYDLYLEFGKNELLNGHFEYDGVVHEVYEDEDAPEDMVTFVFEREDGEPVKRSTR